MFLKYNIKNLNCAGCANKIQFELKKLKEIKDVNLNFYAKTLTFSLVNEKDEERVFKLLNGIFDKIEPGTYIESFNNNKQDEKNEKFNKFTICISLILFIIGLFVRNMNLKNIFLLIAYIISGYDILWKALKNIVKGKVFDENFLMSIATLGAMGLREFGEASGVMIFYKIGEYFQELAVDRSKKSIDKLIKIKPEFANLKLPDGSYKTVDPSEVKIGDIIFVKVGEKISLDGIINKGTTTVDNSALTGEAVPVFVKEGDEVLSGSLNLTSTIEIQVNRLYSDSTISRIIEMVEHATSRKAKTEKFITKFSRYYTPIVVFLALLIGVVLPLILKVEFKIWFERALIFLVISCPCALVLSVPLTFFSSIGRASKSGILIKGGNYLERLKNIDSIVFDKTGTLTKGEFKITKIESFNSILPEKVLEYAKAGEYYSNHPIAKAILKHGDIEIDKSLIDHHKEKAGYGVNVSYKGKNIFIGNRRYMEFLDIKVEFSDDIEESYVYVATNSELIGRIILEDEIKEGSFETIKLLIKRGIEVYMLTGDNKNIAQKIGKALGISKSNIIYNLLPENKVSELERIKEKSSKGVVFIGDGINDAPALSSSDVGISMGKFGSDITIEASDVVLIDDNPLKILELLDIAEKNQKIVLQNIILILGIKLVTMILGVIGVSNLWFAIFADVGVSILGVLNSSRLLKKN